MAEEGRQALIPTSARLPYATEVGEKFKINKASWRVFCEAIFPSAQSPDSIVMALSYCAARGLDIFKRPVHIVPMYNSQLKRMVETVWPGIAELRTTAFRTNLYAGNDRVEWGPMCEREFVGEKDLWEYDPEQRKRVKKGTERVTVTVRYHEWGRMVVYRMVNGIRCAFNGPEIYWDEICARDAAGIPNDRWQKAAISQHEKTIEAAALRRAFPEELGNDLSAEEMEGQVIIDATPSSPSTAVVEDERPPSAEKPADGDSRPTGTKPAQQAKSQPAPAATQKAEPKKAVDAPKFAVGQFPDPNGDPDAYIDWLNVMLGKANTAADFLVIRGVVDEHLDSFLGPDREEIEGILDHAEQRFA